jgi:hypothetical protein
MVRILQIRLRLYKKVYLLKKLLKKGCIYEKVRNKSSEILRNKIHRSEVSSELKINRLLVIELILIIIIPDWDELSHIKKFVNLTYAGDG